MGCWHLSKKEDDRSYVVEVGDGEYHGNRRHVIVDQEDPLTESPDLVEAAPPVLGDCDMTSDPQPTGPTETVVQDSPPSAYGKNFVEGAEHNLPE